MRERQLSHVRQDTAIGGTGPLGHRRLLIPRLKCTEQSDTYLHVIVLLEELHAPLHDGGQVQVHHFVGGPVACRQHLDVVSSDGGKERLSDVGTRKSMVWRVPLLQVVSHCTDRLVSLKCV